MSAEPDRGTARSRWQRHSRLLLSIGPMVGILVALILFDLNETDHMPWTEDPCGLHDSEQNTLSARMYLPIARWAWPNWSVSTACWPHAGGWPISIGMRCRGWRASTSRVPITAVPDVGGLCSWFSCLAGRIGTA